MSLFLRICNQWWKTSKENKRLCWHMQRASQEDFAKFPKMMRQKFHDLKLSLMRGGHLGMEANVRVQSKLFFGLGARQALNLFGAGVLQSEQCLVRTPYNITGIPSFAG